jgi:hypothetical protein
VQQKAGENAYEIFENAIAGSGGRQSDERQFELPLGDSLLNPKIGFGIVR